MNIILCEGNTDAILISYFLIKVHGFTHLKDKKEPIKLPAKQNNESLYWYKHNNKPNTVIWAVGGIDRLQPALKDVIDRNYDETNDDLMFKKIVVMVDRDTRNDTENNDLIKKWVNDSGVIIKNDISSMIWNPREMFHNIHGLIKLQILPVLIPPDNDSGALEDFLLAALTKRSDEEKSVVDEAKKFIDKIPDKPFVHKKRLRSKACLGSSLAVFSPDWVFNTIDKKLRSVPWEEMEKVYKTFAELKSL